VVLRRLTSALLVSLVTAATLIARDAPKQALSCGIDLKLLVLSADGTEPVLPAITRTLDYLGTPYTLHVASRAPGSVTAEFLTSGCRGFYQGVVQTSASLAYFGDGGWQSALTQAERDALTAYETEFGVRQVNWYSFPSPDLGLHFVDGGDTTATPVPITLTAAGKSVFSYLAAAGGGGGALASALWGPVQPLQIRNAWTYFASTADELTTPLIVDPQGRVLAAVRRDPSGREMLTMTFDGNPNLIHTVALGYGLVNWVTRGVFVGERRIYMNPQVDDVLIASDRWLATTPCGTPLDATGSTVRMDGMDLLTAVVWQRIRGFVPLSSGVRLTMAFNGIGATGLYPKDSLAPAVRALETEFFWTSHTYSHPDFDTITYDAAMEELEQNLRVARTGLRLSPAGFNRTTLVTPHVSGLGNEDAMSAVDDAGIRYIVSDTSQPAYQNLFPNTGTANAMVPEVFEIPRRPTNLFFNVVTPAEWEAEYNCIYEGFWGRPLSYAEILDKESDTLLLYMLRGEIHPWMFHQANLRRYDGVRTLLTELLDATLAKYRSIYGLPVESLPMEDIGAWLEARTALRAAAVAAFRAPDGTITVTADRPVTVPITGLRTARSDSYGGQPITSVSVTAKKPAVVRPR
jgi:hypothetical protein